MADWLKKITSLITSSTDSVAAPFHDTSILGNHQKLPSSLFEISSQTTKNDITFQSVDKNQRQPTTSKPGPCETPAKTTVQSKEEDTKVQQEPDDENLKALKRLRDLPRGTQVDSRIAAIKSLLGETEIFKTLKMLRWPQGVICPRCHSSNTIRKEPPHNATDKRHYYVCLNCKGEGNPSDFDDFTGLPIGEMRALRQWILCWYLIGFCSMAQIAKILGISMQEVMQFATLGNDLTELPEEKMELQAKQEFKERKTQSNKKARQQVEEQEDYTRSESKAPLKPSPFKSKK